MWATVDGLRVLRAGEADLVRGTIANMVDHLAAEYRDESEAWRYGIDWFDNWDCDQRIWLLEQVTRTLLTRKRPLPAAAIWEATVDAIFAEVIDLIEIEITDPTLTASSRSWRDSVIDAFESQHGRRPDVTSGEVSLARWRQTVAQIAETILGPTSYLKAEAFRDAEIGRSHQFLQQRGLPADYLDRIPPVRSVEQTNVSLDRIREVVGSSGT